MPRPDTSAADAALRALRDHISGIDLDAALRCGPFRLRRKIGAGAVADVYSASKGRSEEERFAIKLFRLGVGGEELLRRFEQERRLLEGLTHAGFVRVVDGGMHPSGTPWFAMPLVDGAPITHACDAGGLGMGVRLRAAVALADAVAAAHAAGLVHRDLKPGNVLLEAKAGAPAVRIIDLGIARTLAAEGPRITPSGVAHRLGTPAYMAPEQWKHGIAECDARADVFAIGMIAGEVAAGVLPREPATPAKAGRSRRARVAPPPPCLPSAAFARLREGDPAFAAQAAKVRGLPRAPDLQALLAERVDPVVGPMIAMAREDRPADASEAAELLRTARWG